MTIQSDIKPLGKKRDNPYARYKKNWRCDI